MVQRVGKSLHQITDEITRWREILAVPYQEYLQATKLELGVGTYTDSIDWRGAE